MTDQTFFTLRAYVEQGVRGPVGGPIETPYTTVLLDTGTGEDVVLADMPHGGPGGATIANEMVRRWNVLPDFEDDHRAVMSEQCAPDEKHCTCVPPLRAENAKLRAALRIIGIRAHAEAGGKDRPGYVAIYHAADSALDATR